MELFEFSEDCSFMYCCRENAVVWKALKLVKLQVMVLKYIYNIVACYHFGKSS